MPVEIDCYTLRRTADDLLNNSCEVAPGSSENVTFLRNARLLVFCDVDNTKGTVYILGHRLHKQVEARMYQPLDDVEGTRVSVNEPIAVTGDILLAITTKRGRKREVSIYLGGKDDNSDFEDSPTGSPEDVKPLVTV